jgi:hypothetical protein
MDIDRATDELIELAAKLHDLVNQSDAATEALDVATDLCRKCTRVVAYLVDEIQGSK